MFFNEMSPIHSHGGVLRWFGTILGLGNRVVGYTQEDEKIMRFLVW